MRPSAIRPGDSASVCDSATFRHLLGAAVLLLSHRSEAINSLNVFPVPDGDTGTNMLLTMRAAVRCVEESQLSDVGSLAEVLARGALMGARGNSGVILSQFLTGLARGFVGFRQVDGVILAGALVQAASVARAAVTRPVEGTMLTVASDVATAATAEASISNDLTQVMRRSVDEARESVGRTRDLMPVLREANVVDSGGMGLFTILEAMYLAYIGAELPLAEEVIVRIAPSEATEQPTYGYCTEFLIRGRSLDVAVLRERLGDLGDSLLVVGDPLLVRVHIHTTQPGRAIDLALGHGAVEQVKIDNMQEQHDRLRGTHSGHAEQKQCGLVVVSVGDGFSNVYRSLDATIIPGGQTFNPSTREILDGLQATHAREYVLLPNNRNVLLSARQAGSESERPVAIVQTRNLAEGVAAALAFQADRSSEENAVAMRQVVADIRTGLVTRSVRDTVVDGRPIQVGDVLGIIDDRVDSIGSDPLSVSLQVLQSIGASKSEVITIYAGEGTTSEDVETLRARVSAEFTAQQVEVVHGGQPVYIYILACE